MTQGRYEIMIGRRVKRWVVVEEAGKSPSGKRRVRVRCVCCDEEKEIVAEGVRPGYASDCVCGRPPRNPLPTMKGIACNARHKACERSRGGECCYWCKDKERCENMCLNSPDKCGSFFSDKTEGMARIMARGVMRGDWGCER